VSAARTESRPPATAAKPAPPKAANARRRPDPSTGTVQQGVPLALETTVINSETGSCVPLTGATLIAVRLSDSTVINGTGAAVSGYATAASAKPGDILEIFGTGFGPTKQNTAPSLVFTGADENSNALTVTIGGQPATVSGRVWWKPASGKSMWSRHSPPRTTPSSQR
jgi:hypothetical protein